MSFFFFKEQLMTCQYLVNHSWCSKMPDKWKLCDAITADMVSINPDLSVSTSKGCHLLGTKKRLNNSNHFHIFWHKNHLVINDNLQRVLWNNFLVY